jgi:hypothetical protein
MRGGKSFAVFGGSALDRSDKGPDAAGDVAIMHIGCNKGSSSPRFASTACSLCNTTTCVVRSPLHQAKGLGRVKSTFTLFEAHVLSLVCAGAASKRRSLL